jgi:hypothetical protein
LQRPSRPPWPTLHLALLLLAVGLVDLVLAFELDAAPAGHSLLLLL